MPEPRLVAEHGCHGGVQRFYEHDSVEVRGPMRFSVFVPPQARGSRVPVLFFLSGLTCTDENFPMKAQAQQSAAALGILLVAPDTSPRVPRLPGDADSWDFGWSAGFYVDATQPPWSPYYRMYSYVTRELPALVDGFLPVVPGMRGICGHSMGGHGALVCALRNPGLFRSVSAFAPIAAPMQCPWGQKAFTNFLGADRDAWRAYDASELVARQPFPGPVLIDQGSDDRFLAEQLMPQKFVEAAARSGQAVNLRMQRGYDHGYYFIQTFIADHLRHHAAQWRSGA